MVKCKHGRLASPIREPKSGYIRHCKLAKKTRAGRKADRSLRSGEFHERRYRREKSKGRR